jgi:hypothetical protein
MRQGISGDSNSTIEKEEAITINNILSFTKFQANQHKGILYRARIPLNDAEMRSKVDELNQLSTEADVKAGDDLIINGEKMGLFKNAERNSIKDTLDENLKKNLNTAKVEYDAAQAKYQESKAKQEYAKENKKDKKKLEDETKDLLENMTKATTVAQQPNNIKNIRSLIIEN